jgi:hypothetical protein
MWQRTNRQAKERVKVRKVLGDGGYDIRENFKFLAGDWIEAGIKVRRDCNPYVDGRRR